MIEPERMKAVGARLDLALQSFTATKDTPTSIRIEPHDRIVERHCSCGGDRAVGRQCIDNAVKRICIDCGNEVGRETSGEIGEN